MIRRILAWLNRARLEHERAEDWKRRAIETMGQLRGAREMITERDRAIADLRVRLAEFERARMQLATSLIAIARRNGSGI